MRKLILLSLFFAVLAGAQVTGFSPTSGSISQSVVPTITLNIPNGWAYLYLEIAPQQGQDPISTGAAQPNSCTLELFIQPGNPDYTWAIEYSDSGSQFVQGYAVLVQNPNEANPPFSSGSIGNSQCSVGGYGLGAQVNYQGGSTYQIVLPLSFQASFTGSMVVSTIFRDSTPGSPPPYTQQASWTLGVNATATMTTAQDAGPTGFTSLDDFNSNQKFVNFVNETRGGNTFFNIGDKYVWTILGPANVQITASRTQNGVNPDAASPGGVLNLGSTSSPQGSWLYENSIQPTEGGFWVETWSLGGIPISTFVFNVSSNPPPCHVYNPNLTRGGTHFIVGDAYNFQITGGPPNGQATIYRDRTGSGVIDIIGPQQLDQYGNWSYAGTIQSSEVPPAGPVNGVNLFETAVVNGVACQEMLQLWLSQN